MTKLLELDTLFRHWSVCQLLEVNYVQFEGDNNKMI